MQSKRTGRYANLGQTEATTFRPQLTSLIDVMIFLLVFLIKSFSVQGDVITPSANLQLPLSASQKVPKVATSLEITSTSIASEGNILASLSAFAPADSMLIPGVYQWMVLKHAAISDTTLGRTVLIQADRESEYAVLKRVMYSCSKAGFSDFMILAIQKE